MKTAFFALNRHNKTVALLNEFPTWEECQMVFHVGIAMPDGERATGIGRCQDMHDFARRLSQWTFLESPARREFLIDHFQKRGWLNCSHKSQVRLECEYEAYRRGTDKHTLRAVKLSALTTESTSQLANARAGNNDL